MKERRPSGEPALAEVGPPITLSLDVAAYPGVRPPHAAGCRCLGECSMKSLERTGWRGASRLWPGLLVAGLSVASCAERAERIDAHTGGTVQVPECPFKTVFVAQLCASHPPREVDEALPRLLNSKGTGVEPCFDRIPPGVLLADVDVTVSAEGRVVSIDAARGTVRAACFGQCLEALAVGMRPATRNGLPDAGKARIACVGAPSAVATGGLTMQ